MRQDHVRSFVPDDGGAEFVFSSPYDLDGSLPGERLTQRIFAAEVPGADDEYQEAHQTYETRTWSVRGRLITDGANDLTDLQAQLDALFLNFRKGRPGRIYRKIVDLDTGDVLSSRFMKVRVAYCEKGEESGLPTVTWEVGFRSRRAVYEEDTTDATTLPRSASLSTADGGVANLTMGGVLWVRPKITLVVTTPGTITLTPGSAAADQPAITIEAETAATYILDSDTQPKSATRAGLSVLSLVSGGFFELPPDACTITTDLSGGAVLSDATIEWRRCYPFAT